KLLSGVHLIRLDDALLDRAAELDPTEIRSLDSIHLAAAASLGDDLAAVVSYDDRLLAAAASLGLPTAMPVRCAPAAAAGRPPQHEPRAGRPPDHVPGQA